MLISKEQQEANRQNAQHSTGPVTPEGKEAVRFNALTWSLCARSLIIRSDDPQDYQRLWDALDAEWQTQTETERHYLERMCISKWLLIRTADSERRIYQAKLPLEKELALLDRVSVRRVRLERSFTAALDKLKQQQKERRAQPQPQPAETAKVAPEPAHEPAEPQAPFTEYKMAEANGTHTASCAPDTR